MIRKAKHGFTLVEVGLFLAVTGMLFIGIVAGVQGSMYQQRYNDAVQGFVEFLRTVYSQTSNVEGLLTTGGGRTNKAVYGKLLTFGESKNLEGQENTDGAIFSYTVIGDADGDIGSGDVLEALAEARANIFIQNGDNYDFAGIAEQYIPRWESKIQTTKGPTYTNFEGMILIVRHPSSGTVFTYVREGKPIEINLKKQESSSSILEPLSEDELKTFKVQNVDFCVNAQPEKASSKRRDVRIVAGARNASGVELIGQDDDTPGVGNKCQ